MTRFMEMLKYQNNGMKLILQHKYPFYYLINHYSPNTWKFVGLNKFKNKSMRILNSIYHPILIR